MYHKKGVARRHVEYSRYNGDKSDPARVNAGAVSHRSKPVTAADCTPTLKRCPKCSIEYPATAEHFYRDRSRTSGLGAYCKKCENERKAIYFKRPEVVERMRLYNRTDRTKDYQREYRHRPEVLERERKRWRTPEYRKRLRLKANIRRGTEGSFTAADIEAIRKAQGNRCYLCGKKLKKYHIDHFIPLARGGTNDPGNLRLACPKCNLTKSAKHPFELGRLI